MTLPGEWEELPPVEGSTALRRRLRRDDGEVVAVVSLESLVRGNASRQEFAAAASEAPAWRRTVGTEDDEASDGRVLVLDLTLERVAGDPAPRIRRTATLTTFLPDACLQLRLATHDLFAFGDLGAAVRELAATIEWERLP
jgi:hypothetical protein